MTRNGKQLPLLPTGQSKFLSLIFAAVVAGIALLIDARPASGAPPKSPSYAIVKLNDANGAYSDAWANDINNMGQIVGQLWDSDALRAAYWELTALGGKTQSTLRVLRGDLASAIAINDLGEIVGQGIDASTGIMPALYWSSPDADPIVLPSLPGHDRASASRINNDGVVCGTSTLAGDEATGRAVAWRINLVDGTPVVWGPLALPDLGTGSRSDSINDNDAEGIATIVGKFETSATAAASWSVQSLPNGTLAVASIPGVLDLDAQAYGVNDSDAICGASFGIPTEAVVWTGWSRRILNRASFVTKAWANDISNGGVIVGTGSYLRGFERGERAVVWPTANGSMILLDKYLASGSPFSHLTVALSVNDQGLIIGQGWMGSTQGHAPFVAIQK